jgi:hypothetical protein
MAKYVKPTLETKFHIDFAWWRKQGQNLDAYLHSHLCPEAKKLYENSGQNQTFDWIRPETGEVFQLDMLWHIIQTECSHQPNFIEDHTPLTVAIFRLFIANNNLPLTPLEIHQRLPKKKPDLILKTIGGHQVYQGIRPVA